MRKNKFVFPFPSDRIGNRKFQKKRRKFKKIKNTIVASFQAKIGWKSFGDRKEKLSFCFVPN